MMIENKYEPGYDAGYQAGQFLGTGFYNLVSLKITIESVVVLIILAGIILLVTNEKWKHKIPHMRGNMVKKPVVVISNDPATDKRWKDRLVLGGIIILAVFVWIIITPASPESQAISKYEKMSLNEMKGLDAYRFDMTSLARNPDQFAGDFVSFDGKIIQTQQTGANYILRVSAGSGIAEGTQDVWVSYKLKSGEDRPLEGDRVEVYGVFTGLKTYTTVLGASKTIPEVTAFFI